MTQRLFSPPKFETEEENFRAKFINGFIWATILLISIALILNLIPGIDKSADTTISILVSFIFVMLLSLYFLHRKNLRASGIVIVVLGWIGTGVQAYTAAGAKDVIVIAYIAIALLASVIINWRTGSAVILLSIGAIWALAILEGNGLLQPKPLGPITYSRDISLIFLAIAVLIYFSATSLREAITRTAKNEQHLLSSNKNLQEINQNLEERVSQRAAELDNANRFNSKRARQFEAISQVVRAILSTQNLETLLPQITNVISEQFHIYHTGIFLVDDNRAFAVLRAANSEGGKRMLAQDHKLEVAQSGIVGFVSASGQPRLALDAGSDVVFFNNPDLPNTHSEIALPLRSAGQTFGVLDLQSEDVNAFNQDDVEILILLADQVAITIKNTLILEEAREAFSKFQRSTNDETYQSWKILQPKSIGLGLQLTGSKIKPLTVPLGGKHIQQAFNQNKAMLSSEDNASSSLAIPIRLRGQVIGVINLSTRNKKKISSDNADIAKAVTDRLSLAIETATLLQSTQHRADIERLTTHISSKISSSTSFDTILQTAAQELSKALGGSDVLVQIEPISIEDGMEK